MRTFKNEEDLNAFFNGTNVNNVELDHVKDLIKTHGYERVFVKEKNSPVSYIDNGVVHVYPDVWVDWHKCNVAQ